MYPTFLDLKASPHTYKEAKTVILPIPYECTTSYIVGTKYGPESIIDASPQLEYYDSELKKEVIHAGIYTQNHLSFNYQDPVEDLLKIENEAIKHLDANKWLLSLGGEHTVSVPLFKAHYDYYNKNIGLVHLDAHFDLRQEYEGTIYSHACILRRIRELCTDTLSLGIRAYSQEEAEHAQAAKLNFYRDIDIYKQNFDLVTALKKLPEKIYLTIDLDFFSPGVFPSLGTPVPGGPSWWEGLEIIRTIFAEKTVVGADIVELCPIQNQVHAEFSAAWLALKCIAYKQAM